MKKPFCALLLSLALSTAVECQTPDQVVEFDPLFGFGWNGVIVGDQAIFGMPFDSPNQQTGKVYILERDALGHWDQVQVIDGQTSNPFGFGRELAEAQGRLVVGVQSIAARIYSRQASGQWAFVQEVVVANGQASRGPLALSHDGEWLALGDFEASVGGVAEVGTVFLYRWNSAMGQYEFFGNLDTPNPQSAPSFPKGFGSAIEFTNGRCLIFSDHESVLFDFYFDGTSWVLANQIPAPGMASTALIFTPYLHARSGELVLGRDDWPGTPSQPTYVYRMNGQGGAATWSLTQSIPPVSTNGGAVIPRWIDGDTLLITQSGSHSLYERTGQGGAFQPAGFVKAWADFGAPLPFSRDEFLWLTHYFTPSALPEMVVCRPNLEWIGEPVVYPNEAGASGRAPTLGALGSMHTSDNDLVFHVGGPLRTSSGT